MISSPDDAVMFLDHCVDSIDYKTLENVVVEKETGNFCLDIGLINYFFEAEKWPPRRNRRSHPLKLLVSVGLMPSYEVVS